MPSSLDAALLQQLERHALALPGVVLDIKWGGVRVLQIEGKMFATFHDGGVAFKVDADDFLALCDLPGVTPAPYLARARWIKLHTLQSFSVAQIEARLAAARIIVLSRLSKATRAQYGL